MAMPLSGVQRQLSGLFLFWLFFSSRRDIQHFGVKVSIVGHSFFNIEANSGIMERDLLRLWNRLPNEIRDSYGEKYFSECK